NGGCDTLILAGTRAESSLGQEWETRWDVIDRFQGSAVVGRKYKRPLNLVGFEKDAKDDSIHEVVVGADFVSEEDGTGIVHLAPAFGADDYEVAKRNNLAFLQPVNGQGRFAEDIPLVGGMFFKEADKIILEELKRL